MPSQPSLSACPGCGLLFPASDGPTHPYIGASPGCWALYGEVLVREYGEYRYPDIHRLTVDTYAVQHPGTPSPRAVQSVGGHLIGLHLVLEKGFSAQQATAALKRAVAQSKQFVWLAPPASPGAFTVADVALAQSLAEHVALVEQWARAVWTAWAMHHATVRHWAEAVGTRS